MLQELERRFMISLSAPEGLKTRHVVAGVVLSLAVFLLPPDSFFQGMNADWVAGLILFPVTLIVGFCSAWHYYGRHDTSSIDPFYLRAWWSLISGMVGLPVCLLFRPSVAALAFCFLTFGAGPVAGFHLSRRITRRPDGA